MNCSLCGYEFDKDNLSCHTACPLSKGCHIICCPNCGYQVVDESKSETLQLLGRLKDKLSAWSSLSDAR
jgi:hypothetical protein